MKLLLSFAIFSLVFSHPTSFYEYQELWKSSVENPLDFWKKEAEMIDWIEPPKKIWQEPIGEEDCFVGRWFLGGKLNAADLCTTRWMKRAPDKIALIWVGEEDTDEHPERRIFTYKELTEEVNRTANLFKSLGVKKGDRVCIYLPMIPELPIAQLACAKIGAIHSVVFGGFSKESLKDRICDASCKLLITADEAIRGGKRYPLKETADFIIGECPSVEKVLVVKRTGKAIPMYDRDLFWNEKPFSSNCLSEAMDAEDPLFILYTSGTTGKPKGIVHTTAGYLIYALSTLKYAWGAKGLLLGGNEIFFCTADIGWITGHTYGVYGPLAMGMTTFLYEGTPTYPHEGRFWELIDRYQITHFYTSPTVIRMLKAKGEECLKPYKLSSLQVLGTVGEPINPDAWHWFHEKIGKLRCPLLDTYWQTETGGYLVTPLAFVSPLKPGSCTFPFFGIRLELLSEEGTPIEKPYEKGCLCISQPWPGMMRTIYQDHERFLKNYLKRFPGKYFTGDAAYFDEEGFLFIAGRLDDVIKVSGHRLGTAEIEGAIASHPSVAEAAVVSIPDSIKGEAIVAFVSLKKEHEVQAEELIGHVADTIGSFAKPKKIFFVEQLPKTRSGKIVRRILKALATGGEIGDISTLIDPSSVEKIREVIANHSYSEVKKG